MLPSILTTLLFSISIVCATRSARMLGGSEANFWRLAVATGLLAIWAHIWGQGLGGDSFPAFLFSGIIGVGADVFLFQALPRLGSRLSVLIVQCFSAVSAATMEWFWLKTKLTGPQIIACIIILGGVATALAPGKHLNITRKTLIVGVIFGLLAGGGNAIGAVLSRKAYAIAKAAHQDIDGATGAYQRLIGGLFVAGIVLLVVRRREVDAQFTEPGITRLPNMEKWRAAWPWVLSNAVAGQTLGVTCYQWAFKTTPTGLVLAVVATAPLIVIPFSYHLEGEKLSARSIIGGGIAVCGAVLLIRVR